MFAHTFLSFNHNKFKWNNKKIGNTISDMIIQNAKNLNDQDFMGLKLSVTGRSQVRNFLEEGSHYRTEWESQWSPQYRITTKWVPN